MARYINADYPSKTISRHLDGPYGDFKYNFTNQLFIWGYAGPDDSYGDLATLSPTNYSYGDMPIRSYHIIVYYIIVYIYIYTHTYVHTYIHKYIHTYICIYIYIYI